MSEYEHHAPRVINKSKKPRGSVNEESIVSRQSRISFKSYVRQLSEQDGSDEQDTWIVERGILENVDDKYLTWNELAAFADMEEADAEVDSYRELEVGDAVFRTRQV